MRGPEVIIIGAGQAGLCTSYFLSDGGIDHVVLERGWRGTVGGRAGGTASPWSLRTGPSACRERSTGCPIRTDSWDGTTSPRILRAGRGVSAARFAREWRRPDSVETGTEVADRYHRRPPGGPGGGGRHRHDADATPAGARRIRFASYPATRRGDLPQSCGSRARHGAGRRLGSNRRADRR